MEQVGLWVLGVLRSPMMLMTVAVVPVMMLLEWRWPARDQPWHHYLLGTGYWFSNMLLLAVVLPVFNGGVAYGVQQFGLGLIDLGALGLGGFGGALLALLVSTFVLDFFFYWFHRSLHADAWLWQTHLLHHSDEHMNAMTAQRGHIAETFLVPLFITVPMAVLFRLPPVTIGMLSVLPYAYQFLAHANIRLNYGRLWWLIISPDYHRIHHSIEPRHRAKNFTNWFPVWDVLFGTVYVPAKDERPATGVEGVEVRTVGQAFILPFTGWAELLRRPRVPAPAKLRRTRRAA
jgi:sterol desaturase/sphingolipid hydroxylase (fatty acid hydroxylase superfamily)